MANFWRDLKKPFFVLAPMEDVTDFAFRELVATSLPKPHVFFTEFTNTDALFSAGRESVMRRLTLGENQRPIVAQIWGTNPELFYKAAQEIVEMGFDGIDINMGCPVREVTKKGAGAAMCLNHELTKEVIDATRKGSKGIPLSVKTRIGMNTIISEEWIGFLLEQKLDALTVHARTAKEQSKVPAHWEEIGKSVELKNKIAPETIFIGNGDVENAIDGIALVERYGVDGIMIGRGIFHNPWAFAKEQGEHTKEECIDLLKKHLELYRTTWGEKRNWEVMKKFFKMYVNNFHGASQMRQELMECKTYEDVDAILKTM